MIFSKKSIYFPIAGIVSILLLLLIISVLVPLLRYAGLQELTAPVFFISRMLYWLALALLWIYSVSVENQPLLIWEEKKYQFTTYVGSIVLVLVVLAIVMIVVNLFYRLTGLKETSTTLSEVVNILRNNSFLVVLTPLTAGVVEELIFRGYIQPRLEIIFKKPYAAIIISSVLFGLLHYSYGTIINMIGPFLIGLIFAVHYWKYRNIKMVIICHFLWDLIAIAALVNWRH